MELKNLRCLVEVVRQGTFSRAAGVLHATQPTISKAIGQLESQFDTRLLERSRRGVRLTAEGEVVHRRAQAMLLEREGMQADLDELRGLRRGELRLGLPPMGSNVLFAPTFARFRRQHPHIDIRLMEHGSRRLEQALMAGEVELAASLLPVSEHYFQWQSVHDEPMVAILPRTHALAGRKSLTLDAFRDEPQVLFEGGFALDSIIRNACVRRGFTPFEGARTSQLDFAIALVGANLGVAVLPRLVAADHTHPDVVTVPLDEPDLRWQMALIWRSDAALSPAARSWLELLAEDSANGPAAASKSRSRGAAKKAGRKSR